MADNNTVLLRVELSEGKTEEQLKKLTLDMEATRKAQAALTLERRAGIKTDDEYAAEAVKLQLQLKSQRTEYAANQKNLELYRTATGELANTYKGTQAQLSLAQRQYQELQGSQDNSTESTKALANVVDELRNKLKETDAQQSLFVRNVGNYPKGSEGLEKLVQQLVSLQEEQKRYVMGSEQEIQVRQRIGFFQQAAAQAGAKEGKTYEETTDFVRQYGEAIRPATADLIKLTEQQEQLAQSSEDVGEQLQQIGFKIGQAQSEIKKSTDALKEVPEVAAEGAKETKSLGAGLLDAAKSSDVLGGAVEVLTTAKEKYTAAAELAKVATAGEVTVLGALKLALIATGLGALVVVLGLVVSGLLKSQAATDFLSRKMAFLGGVIQPLINLGAELAEKLVAAAEDPKQAFEDLVDFLETNLANRLKAFGVIIDAIRNRDFTRLTDGVVQLGTGITDATAKAKAFGQEVAAAATSAEAIEKETQRIREAERALNVERDQSRAKIEGLKKASDDSTKSVAARTVAAKEAARIENALLAEQQKLQDDKIKNLRAEQSLKRSLTTEDKDALAALQRERAQTDQESLTLQTELQNKINSLVQEGIDKSITGRAQAIALEQALLNKQLAQVQVNSDKELAIRQQLLNKGREAELNVKNLTVAQKLAIDAKYETDSAKLAADFRKERILAAYDAESATVSAELTLVQQGTQQETELRREAIDTQLRKELAALDQRKDNAAQEQLLRANAAKAINDVNYSAALANLNKYLQDERNAIDESFARGKIKEEEYNKAVLTSDVTATAARLQLAKSFSQNSTEEEQALTAAKIASIKAVTEAERTEQAKRVAAAQSLAEGLTSLFAETVATTGATMEDFARKAIILLIDSVEKSIVAAQIKIIAEAFSSADSIASFGITGLAKSAAIIGLVVAATETLKAKLQPGNDQFADGGIAYGPSHAQGGIPLYQRGRAVGIEIEGGEPVLTKNVTANPLLLSLASAVNQLAGGRALVPHLRAPHMALGGVAQPLVLDQLRGNATEGIDYDRLARTLQRVNLSVAVRDIDAAQDRKAFTDSQANR